MELFRTPLMDRILTPRLLLGCIPERVTPAQVLACLRMELFRTLLMERIEFFDRHAAAELAGLLSVELDALRAFVFGNVSRDRGARAALEATGAVAVLFVLSWRLGPVLAAVIVVRAPHSSLCTCGCRARQAARAL